MTAEQRREALAEAAERYGFPLPESGPPEAAQSLLALFVVYEQVRAALNLTTYPEVDEALRTDVPVSAEHDQRTGVGEGACRVLCRDAAALTETALLAGLEE